MSCPTHESANQRTASEQQSTPTTTVGIARNEQLISEERSAYACMTISCGDTNQKSRWGRQSRLQPTTLPDPLFHDLQIITSTRLIPFRKSGKSVISLVLAVAIGATAAGVNADRRSPRRCAAALRRVNPLPPGALLTPCATRHSPTRYRREYRREYRCGFCPLTLGFRRHAGRHAENLPRAALTCGAVHASSSASQYRKSSQLSCK